VNPLIRRAWLARDELYLCLEGSFKADAVLCAGWPAISSTSITTWEGEHLKALLPQLHSARMVYVVCDSDYFASDRFRDHLGAPSFNPDVVYWTRRAAQWLHYRKVTAKIAIPWCAESEDEKTGVDDFLRRGYRLEEMHLLEPLPNALVMMPSIRMTRDQERVLRWLLKHQGHFGAFMPGEVAKRLRVDPKTVYNAYRYFEDQGVLRVYQGFPRLNPDGTGGGNRPHKFVAYELIAGYREFLQTIPVPVPVRAKLGMFKRYETKRGPKIGWGHGVGEPPRRIKSWEEAP
jgi:hypothetical protein